MQLQLKNSGTLDEKLTHFCWRDEIFPGSKVNVEQLRIVGTSCYGTRRVELRSEKNFSLTPVF